jgi:hypothetical protein
MMSTRFVHNNTHVGFLLIVFSRIKNTQLLGLNHYAYMWRRKLVLCISYEARKQKSIKKKLLYSFQWSFKLD